MRFLRYELIRLYTMTWRFLPTSVQTAGHGPAWSERIPAGLGRTILGAYRSPVDSARNENQGARRK